MMTESERTAARKTLEARLANLEKHSNAIAEIHDLVESIAVLTLSIQDTESHIKAEIDS